MIDLVQIRRAAGKGGKAERAVTLDWLARVAAEIEAGRAAQAELAVLKQGELH